MTEWQTWLDANQTVLWALMAGSIATFIGSLIVIPWLLIRMPADYFIHPERPMLRFFTYHPLLRVLGLVLKNLFGGLFVLAGLAMLVLPGQGILTLLIGLSLMNFPGKRYLELRLVRQPAVLHGINWIRNRRQRPPLQLPEP